MGANKPERVKRIMYSCFGITTMIGLVLGLAVVVFSQPLLGLYGVIAGEEGSLEALAMNAALVRFRYICAPYFLCGLMEVCTGVLRGLGKAIVSTVISLVGACLLRVVWLMTVFPAYPTLEIIFVSYPITWIVTTATAFAIIQILLKGILKRSLPQSTALTAPSSEGAEA